MTLLPDLEELVALRGAAQSLSLRSHRSALARLQGSHRSAQRGRGLEFEEVRPYAIGDDARSIDWRVTARRGRPHTKLYREDRERPVWLLVDLHAGLFFGSKRQFKSALMLRAAALLGWAAVRGGDRLGAVITTGTETAPQIFPPHGREAGILPILEALVEGQPRAPVAVNPAGGLRAALATLQPLLRPGSLVLVLSDFSGLDPEVETLLAGVMARCDGHLLWITDPLEAAGLPAGEFRVGLPGRLWWLDGARSRRPWQEAWSAREQGLDQLARRLNLPLTRLDTPDDVTRTLPPLLRAPAWAA
ncbi:MAG: DUF58 domain-containing protein [Panacagrimonas sp.]